MGGYSGKQTLKANGTRFSILILTLLTIAALTAVWMIPSTAEESVVEISTLDQLKTFRDNVNKDVSNDISVKLTANINLEGSESKQWTPIGDCVTNQYGRITTDHSFKGKFDGQGYTISGLYISTDKDYQGLFGCVSGDAPEVKNLTVSGSVVADEYVGIIVGGLRKGTVKNCTSDGSVSGIGILDGGIGGIVGGVGDGSTVTDCTSTGSIKASASGSGRFVVSSSGGIVGTCAGASIENCTAIGEVSASNNGTGTGTPGMVVSYSGGIVGYNEAAGSNSTSTVMNCAASGKVSASGNGDKYSGGIVGVNSAIISGNVTVINCAATGGFSESAGANLGGVVGYNKDGTVTNCGWLKSGFNGVGVSGDQGTNVVSFDSAENIVVACLPDPATITVVKGKTATTTFKAWPANKAITAANLSGNITATVSPIDIATAAVDGATASITGNKNGTGAVDFSFSLKPTHFTGDCSGVSTDVSLTPSAVLTVKDAAGFTISPTALSLGINGTGTITASETASWTVSDGTIAKISAETGESVTVTGLAAGTTTITATNELGESATCEVTVTTSGGGGSSGGGCSTGFGTLALLALMPLAWRRKK